MYWMLFYHIVLLHCFPTLHTWVVTYTMIVCARACVCVYVYIYIYIYIFFFSLPVFGIAYEQNFLLIYLLIFSYVCCHEKVIWVLLVDLLSYFKSQCHDCE